MEENNFLKIAIQKSGRLSEESLKLLKDCGISVDNGKDQLMAFSNNFPLEVLYLRNTDIPGYVRDGVADIAIIGDNTEREKKSGVEKVMELGFSKCRVSIAVPKSVDFPGLEWLNGKRIATSYPQTLRDFLDEEGIEASIQEISGSVEISPNIGLADAICDIVSSGSTLHKNGLKEVHTMFRSQAILVASPNLSSEKRAILEQLKFRIEAVLAASRSKYVLMNVPEESLDRVCSLLPGIKSPTIVPLREKGWYSVHTVMPENRFWHVVDSLKEAGAQGLLIMSLEKLIV